MNARLPEASVLPAAQQHPAAGWRATLLALPLLLLALVWLYSDTATAMVTIWSRSETFAHAYTVPPLVAWLIWRQRDALARVTPRPAPWLLLPLAACGLGWLLGDLTATNSVTQLAFTTSLVLAAAALIGVRAAHVILFPLCFLFFAVPIGEFVMPQMMVWTADFTVLALRLSGIPVFREGLQFVIPSGNWSVVEACSGVRYLIASFMVGVLFAYLNYRSTQRRLVFAAVAVVVPVVANWVRAYMIVMLGHLSGNRLAVGADHLVYGWVFFGVVILLMFMIGARWSEPEAAPAAAPRTAVAGGNAAPRALWAVAAAALLVLAVPRAASWALDNAAAAGAAPLLSAPATLAPGWQRADAPAIDWKPAFANPGAELRSAYAAQGREVGVYIGYYRQQSYARKLISSDNVLVVSKDPRWARVAEGSRRIDSSGAAVTWRTATLRGAAAQPRLLVWQLYWVGGHLTASDSAAKVYGALYRLLGRGDDAAVIVLSTPQADGTDADAVLTSFAGANLGVLDALLRRTRDNAQQPRQESKP